MLRVFRVWADSNLNVPGGHLDAEKVGGGGG